MATKTKKYPVVWLQGAGCTGCSVSVLNAVSPKIQNLLLDELVPGQQLNLIFHSTIMAGQGEPVIEVLKDTEKNREGDYILVVEGAIPTAEGGLYGGIGEKDGKHLTVQQSVEELGRNALLTIALGTCACYGGIPAAKPNPTLCKGVQTVFKEKGIKTAVINVPGCPPIGEVMAGTIVYLLTFDKIPQLDGLGRPKSFYSRRVHDTCYRRPNYDAGLFVESFDDENAKRGYCLYKMGCRGPVTYNSCGVIRWNNGVSYPIQSGHGCIGCSEANFWDNGPFYQHLASFPGFGIETTADNIGVAVGAVTVAGIAAHAISTNIRKRKIIRENVEEGISEDQNEKGGE